MFEKIKQMKARSGFPVVNPRESLTEMQRHLRKEPEKFGCLGGHKYFYLDWNLNLYRCHAWETPMCNIYDFDESKLIRDGCTRCMIDCYRDPSVMQFVAISASDAYQNLKKGKSWRRGEKYFRPPQSDLAEGRLGRPQMDWQGLRAIEPQMNADGYRSKPHSVWTTHFRHDSETVEITGKNMVRGMIVRGIGRRESQIIPPDNHSPDYIRLWRFCPSRAGSDRAFLWPAPCFVGVFCPLL